MKSTKIPTQLHYYKPSKDTNPRHLTLPEGRGDQGGTLKGPHTKSHGLLVHQGPTPIPNRPPSWIRNSYISGKDNPPSESMDYLPNCTLHQPLMTDPKRCFLRSDQVLPMDSIPETCDDHSPDRTRRMVTLQS